MILDNNRKNIPPFQHLKRFDIDKLLESVNNLGLLDHQRWDELNYSDDLQGQFANITQMHSDYYSNWFQFTSSKYQDLFLNEIDYTLINSQSLHDFHTKRSRVKVIKDKELLKTQNNAEFIFKPILKKLYKNTYIETVYNQISDMFPGGAGRAKIAFMAANSTVESHIDADSSFILKVHIPLITDPNVMFFVKYQKDWYPYHMQPDGSAILLNVGLPHRVENNSNINRYHLIINVYTK